MRAAVMRNSAMIVDDIPAPQPQAGEVLVKTLACGICGSDLHVLKHAELFAEASRQAGSPFALDVEKDVVMGHEFCAEILEYGPDTARRFEVGTRVCSIPVLLRSGSGLSVGYSDLVPGGYGEQMVLTEAMLLQVPEGLSSEYAALTEPMAVGLHAVEMGRVESNDIPLVIGCGPVGLAVIEALRLKGIGPIVAADFSAGRRKLAELMGAHVVIDPAENSPYEKWTDMASHAPDGTAISPNPFTGAVDLRPGVFFECVGVPGVIDEMALGAGRGCRIVVVGVCLVEDNFHPLRAISKELNLQFVLGYTPEEFTKTLALIASGEMNVEPIVTGKIGIEEVPQAFEDLADPGKHAKIIVEPWRP